MHVGIVSNHVSRDFSSGRLSIQLWMEDGNAGQTRVDEVFFSVPGDFHTHNDSVAAATMTLVGTMFSEVTFNFPISRDCAELLASHYRLRSVEPLADDLEPRRPGRWMALNFSGGFDSVALWCILRRQLRVDFRVITSDYGGRFAHERRSFAGFQRDVTCATNLRERGFDQHGRFNAAAPLLYADYLDLAGLASGHAYRQFVTDSDDFKLGEQPQFVARGDAYLAGGLQELHLCRGVFTTGMLSIVMQALPERLQAAMHGSATLQSEKGLGKALILKDLHQRAGLPEPAWLSDLQLPARRAAPPAPEQLTLRSLIAAKRFGLDTAMRLVPGLDAFDLTFLDDISFEMLGRHNPHYVPYMPDDLRAGLLAAYAHYGIAAFEESDWRELEAVNAFLVAPRLRVPAAPA
jgi:hypothetical protein